MVIVNLLYIFDVILYFHLVFPNCVFKLEKDKDTVSYLFIVILVFKTGNRMILALLSIFITIALKLVILNNLSHSFCDQESGQAIVNFALGSLMRLQSRCQLGP